MPDIAVLVRRGSHMDLQIINRDGEPEYAVLAWADYQALLSAAGRAPAVPHVTQGPVAAASEPVPERPGLNQLRSLRETSGRTAEQLARTVGISPSYLALIETGERLPDAAILRSLAWELGVPGWEGHP